MAKPKNEDKKEKKTYEPPLLFDLGGGVAYAGKKCTPGGSPAAGNCTEGNTAVSGQCVDGGIAGKKDCTDGGMPQKKCNVGDTK